MFYYLKLEAVEDTFQTKILTIHTIGIYLFIIEKYFSKYFSCFPLQVISR